MLAKTYLQNMQALLGELIEKQTGNIERAAETIASAIAAGHSLFGFGCNHSLLPILDIYYRAGGLMLLNPIVAPGLLLELHPPTLTSKMEQLEGYGEIALASAPIKPGDVLIVISVSGRNAVPVEVALRAKALSATVIGVTSRAFSDSVTPRNKLGKKLIDERAAGRARHHPAGVPVGEYRGRRSVQRPATGRECRPHFLSVGQYNRYVNEKPVSP
jgi:uncharacterized phosphosugar-binding protein